MKKWIKWLFWDNRPLFCVLLSLLLAALATVILHKNLGLGGFHIVFVGFLSIAFIFYVFMFFVHVLIIYPLRILQKTRMENRITDEHIMCAIGLKPDNARSIDDVVHSLRDLVDIEFHLDVK